MGIKYAVNEDFFKEWNVIMAYVLGYWYADGSMYPSVRGSYINVSSVDKFSIENIKKWLESEHTIRTENSKWPNGRIRFVLRIGNKTLYEGLLKLGLYPSKSLTVRMPSIPREFIKDFVRGYLDGDGCVYLGMAKGKKQAIIIHKMSVIFTSGSKSFLEDLLNVLRTELNLRQTKIYKSHRAFQLRFCTTDSVKLFKFMYKDTPEGFFFSRKFEVYERYFQLRPRRIDKEVETILRYVRAGRVAKKQTQRSAKPLYMGANPITASKEVANR